MKTSITIPIAILVGGIIVAGAVYFSIAQKLPWSGSSATGDISLLRPVDATDHILGSPTAPVMIIEYSDYDCDYCKGFHYTMHQVIANEGANGKVAWVYRHFPLSEIHPNALAHAEAAECAAKVGGNDAFWKFSDSLFANQPASPSTYGALAAAAGVEGNAFADCYMNASTQVDAHIRADRQNALDIGTRGTPYSVIVMRGKQPIVIPSAYSYDAIKLLLDQALAR